MDIKHKLKSKTIDSIKLNLYDEINHNIKTNRSLQRIDDQEKVNFLK